MINFTGKDSNIIKELSSAGYYVKQLNDGHHAYDLAGNESAEIDAAAQAINDSYDHLPFAQLTAKERIKEASAKQRLKYVTQAAGKDAEYTFKAQEAKQFDIDGSVGIFMQARVNATGDSAPAVASEWNAKSAGWQAVGAGIAAIEDKSSQDIDRETDWTQCKSIANNYISQIEAI